MKGSFYIEKNNKKIKCDILYTFKSNNNDFILFSDGSIDDEGFLNVLASKYTINNDKITLLPVEDNEWNIIDDIWGDINE